MSAWPATRIRSALHYARMAGPPWRWRICRATCPSCGSRYFLMLQPTPFLTRCLRCRATVINLSVIEVLRRQFVSRLAGMRAYELSSYGATFDFLRAHVRDFVFSEYIPGRAPGEIVDGIRNEDVLRLSFADDSFDLVTSNQVFEHVPDDLRAYAECRRVLKPGGALVFTVPLYDTPRTEQVAKLAADGAIEWLRAPEYHDSRLGGPCSAPAFWRHSFHDIAERVATAGFRDVRLEEVSMCAKMGVHRVVVAVK